MASEQETSLNPGKNCDVSIVSDEGDEVEEIHGGAPDSDFHCSEGNSSTSRLGTAPSPRLEPTYDGLSSRTVKSGMLKLLVAEKTEDEAAKVLADFLPAVEQSTDQVEQYADQVEQSATGDIHLYKSLYISDVKFKHRSQHSVGIYVEQQDLLSKWKKRLEFAITEINRVAPGLKLSELKKPDPSLPMITICTHEKPDMCWTENSILHHSPWDKPKIKLGVAYKGKKKRAMVHELLHALGFEHEHQRKDGLKYIVYTDLPSEPQTNPPSEPQTDPPSEPQTDPPSEPQTDPPSEPQTDPPSEPQTGVMQNQVKKKEHYVPLTPFDPYSIMMYMEGEGYKRKEGVLAWKDSSGALNTRMSELDKLALNYVYPPPTIEPSYVPKKNKNGMYYCGREMAEHNRPRMCRVTVCGPVEEGGPNCPACRVLSKPKEMGDKWQGWSGYVYCGKKDCNVHYGKPCQSCKRITKTQGPVVD